MYIHIHVYTYMYVCMYFYGMICRSIYQDIPLMTKIHLYQHLPLQVPPKIEFVYHKSLN